jgi:squalene-hopene cyclase-like protein/prenyltransferase/squalene oxidase-like repeat protein
MTTLKRKRLKLIRLAAASLAVALGLVVALPRLRAADSPSGLAAVPNQVTGDEITDGQRAAVDRGLAWLAGRQAPDGGYDGHAGITALCGLAFMEQGNLPGRGKYALQVEKCLQFVLKSSQQSGLISANLDSGPMYGHGFATLFLGEIYGETGDEEIKEKLQRAVHLIETTQNPQGGWRYQPVPYDADISVTICEVMALRAAQDAGLKVEKSVRDKAIAYVQDCQNDNGGFMYQAGTNGPSGFARTAAGCASLYYAGVFDSDNLRRGLDYMKEQVIEGNLGDRERHFYYANYYAVQAMFLAGGDYWKSYFPVVRDELIRRQQLNNDHWNGDFSDECDSAMALIVLQMPNRYLPVFNGKGPGS